MSRKSRLGSHFSAINRDDFSIGGTNQDKATATDSGVEVRQPLPDVNAAAIAASTAFPPASKAATPASVAIGFTVATMLRLDVAVFAGACGVVRLFSNYV